MNNYTNVQRISKIKIITLLIDYYLIKIKPKYSSNNNIHLRAFILPSLRIIADGRHSFNSRGAVTKRRSIPNDSSIRPSHGPSFEGLSH